MAAIVPAAGRSRRMGRSKALLDAGGRTFLARLIGSLGDGGCAPVLAVVRDAGGPEALEARSAGADVVLNPDPSAGPISSFRSGLGALDRRVDAVAWCPVDHPLVRADTVAALLEEAARRPGCIVLPVHDGRRGHPAVFPRSVFGELTDPALAGGARTVVRRDPSRVRAVPVDDPGVLADIDTPEEYARRLGPAGPVEEADP